MKLREAAACMELKPSYLRRLVADRARPKDKRRYPDATHEHYLTRHFVKDTKGRTNVGRGNFPYEIADRYVEDFVRRRALRLAGGDGLRRRRSADLLKQLRDAALIALATFAIGLAVHGIQTRAAVVVADSVVSSHSTEGALERCRGARLDLLNEVSLPAACGAPARAASCAANDPLNTTEPAAPTAGALVEGGALAGRTSLDPLEAHTNTHTHTSA